MAYRVAVVNPVMQTVVSTPLAPEQENMCQLLLDHHPNNKNWDPACHD
jgi:hypothetical protein